jgi:hypothetical protein
MRKTCSRVVGGGLNSKARDDRRKFPVAACAGLKPPNSFFPFSRPVSTVACPVGTQNL